MAICKLISADSHVKEPAGLWTERIDRKFRDRAPRIVDNIPGRPPSSYLVLVRENAMRLYDLELSG